MYSVDYEYLAAVKEPSRTFNCNLAIGDDTYTNDKIVSLILDTTQANDGYPIGNTVSQSLEVTLLINSDFVVATDKVSLSIGLDVNGAVNYIPMGVYNIDDIEKTDFTIKYTCYDNMIKLETPFFTDLTTCTVSDVIALLETLTGVGWGGTILTNYSIDISKVNGYTCREVLGYVAAIQGGNAYIDRAGKFTILGVNQINYSITSSNYIDYKNEDKEYIISKLSCQVPGADNNKSIVLTSGNNDNMDLQFENPIMTQSILDNIYSKLNNISFLGYTMKWQGDLALDIMDSILCTDVKGVTRRLLILSQKFTYNGGLTSEIGAKGQTKNSNSFSTSGSTSNKVSRIVTEQAIIKEALITKANINDLNVTNEKVEKLESNTASINNLLAGNITAENIQAGTIVAGSSIVADGAIGNAQISDLDVAKLNAGTIDTSKIDIASSDGRMVIKDNSILTYDYINNDLLKPYLRTQMGRIWDIQNGQLVARKDSNDNYVYGFEVRDKDGQTIMIDGQGVHNAGITPGAVDNSKVAPNANISGTKLDVESVVTEINNGDTHISGSRVFLDDKTLDVEINDIKINVNYKVDIISTNGNVFKGADYTTTLMARVYHGSVDVTDTIDSNRFRWTRVSNDTSGDIAWNTAHFGGAKQITVTQTDIMNRATFQCAILDENLN